MGFTACWRTGWCRKIGGADKKVEFSKMIDQVHREPSEHPLPLRLAGVSAWGAVKTTGEIHRICTWASWQSVLKHAQQGTVRLLPPVNRGWLGLYRPLRKWNHACPLGERQDPPMHQMAATHPGRQGRFHHRDRRGWPHCFWYSKTPFLWRIWISYPGTDSNWTVPIIINTLYKKHINTLLIKYTLQKILYSSYYDHESNRMPVYTQTSVSTTNRTTYWITCD